VVNRVVNHARMVMARWRTTMDYPAMDRRTVHHMMDYHMMDWLLRHHRCSHHHSKSHQPSNQQTFHTLAPLVNMVTACNCRCEQNPIVVSPAIRYTCQPHAGP
jgi:hypothetical protein